MIYRQWTFSVLVLAATLPAHAQNLSPEVQTGEIALAGVVQSVSPEKRQLIFASGAFSLPGGKAGKINPPKPKTVSWNDRTAFLLSNAVSSAAQLKVGLQIRVVGPDLGSGKPLVARLLSWSAAKSSATGTLPPAPAIPVTDTPPTGEGQNNGFTFRILDSGFASPDVVWQMPKPFEGVVRRAPGFFVKFEAKSADGTPIDPQSWSKKGGGALKARIYSPLDVSVGNSAQAGNSITSQQVDPSWPFVTVEFYGHDPNAADGLTPNQADGISTEEVSLDLPRPAPGQTVTLGKTLTTRFGSQLVIDSAQFVPAATGNGGEVVFVYAWKAPTDAPSALLTPMFDAIFDDAGQNLSSGSSSKGVPNTQKRESRIRLNSVPQGNTWHFKFSVEQNIPSRAVTTGRFRVRLKVPLTDSKPRSPLPNQTPPVEIPILKTAESLEMRLESDGFDWPNLWRGELWTRETGPNQLLNWQLKEAKFLTDDGQSVTSPPQDMPQTAFFHRDGTRTLKGETRQSLALPLNPKVPRPKSVAVQLKMDGRRSIAHTFSLQTPLPAPGQTRQTDEEVRSDTGAPLTLRAIRTYSSLDELPGLTSRVRVPERGLALIFEAKPVLPGAQLRFDLGDARDEMNRPLNLSFFSNWQPGHALKTGGKDFWTLILSSPAAGAKSLTFEGKMSEEGPVIRQLTVEIPNVPIQPTRKP